MHYAQAGKIQGHAVGAQGQEAAVGGVAQGVRQSPRLISGAAAKEGNSEFPRKAFLPGGFMCPSPMCLLTSHIALYVSKSSQAGSFHYQLSCPSYLGSIIKILITTSPVVKILSAVICRKPWRNGLHEIFLLSRVQSPINSINPLPDDDGDLYDRR